ncbi:MAG: aldehyde dehydrogenase family protein, partial [Acidimicrobiia bacterium]
MTRDLQLFIDGEFTDGTGTEVHELRSPVTGEHIANVPLASQADIDRAVASARGATEEMRHWTAFERAELCTRIYELWQDRIDDIARTLTLEQGKPFRAEAIDDIAESGDYFQIAAEDVKRLSGQLIPTTARTRRMFTVHRPVGVWAAITPWNFPVMIPMEYVGPGLATGNAVIVKPPEFTCMAMLEVAEIFQEAGLPPGAIQVIPGGGTIGEALVTHPGVDAIGFTGSSDTGRRIVSQMGLKRSIMEMSGNGPLVVTGDADVAAAAEAAVYGSYYNAGQVCCATERVIVLDDVHDEFVEAAIKAAGVVKLGDPFDDATTMGPLNNRPTADKMDRHLQDAADRGAEILMGGGRAGGFPTDLYYEFTVIDRVPEESLVSQEESFGPVLPILTARDDEDAVGVANRTRLGLQAAVFTNDLTKAFWYADRIRSGT